MVLTLISLPALSYTQVIPDLPVENGDSDWMRWIILVMVGVIVALFAIVRTMYNDRMSDKDTQIGDLKTEVTRLIISNNELERDIRDKIIPALVSSTDIMREYIKARVK